MTTKTLNTVSDVLTEILNLADSETVVFQYMFSDSLAHSIKIDGPSWSNRVDYRAAEYIIALQNAVDELGKLCYGATYKPKSVVVESIISEGSLKQVAGLIEQFNEMLRILKDMDITWKHVAIVLIAATALVTVVTGPHIASQIKEMRHYELESENQRNRDTLDAEKEMRRDELDAEADERRDEIMNRQLDIIESLADDERKEKVFNLIDQNHPAINTAGSASKKITRHMESGDSIYISAVNESFSYDMQKKRVSRAPHTHARVYYVDGSYIVKKEHHDGEVPQLTLSKEGVSFNAISQLGKDGDKKVWELAYGKKPVDLQVTIRVRRGEIKEAFIVGVDKEPRDSTLQKSFAEIDLKK